MFVGAGVVGAWHCWAEGEVGCHCLVGTMEMRLSSPYPSCCRSCQTEWWAVNMSLTVKREGRLTVIFLRFFIATDETVSTRVRRRRYYRKEIEMVTDERMAVCARWEMEGRKTRGTRRAMDTMISSPIAFAGTRANTSSPPFRIDHNSIAQ